MIQDPPLQSYESKFFIMSKEFTKNISDWRCDCTDYKNGFDFFLTLVKWPKLAVKKSQIFWCYTKERFKQFLTLKIDFENQILAFFDGYFWPFNKSHEKIKSIFVISALYLQSEMYLSNSVAMMKNLPGHNNAVSRWAGSIATTFSSTMPRPSHTFSRCCHAL